MLLLLTTVLPGSTNVKGASTLDEMLDLSYNINNASFCSCSFCAYRDVSCFFWGYILYTGMVVEKLVSVEDAPSLHFAPIRVGS